MLNYNHLHYFHVVASEGSIVRAADRLGLAQPTVSEQLRQLERSLEKPLFERTPSGLKLTDAGRQAFAQTTVMFNAADRMVEDLSGTTARPSTLRVGMSNSASRSVAADFLTPLLKLPDCTPSIRTGDSIDLLRQLRDNAVDLVLSEETPPTTEGIKVVEIYRPQLLAVAAPERVDAPNGRTWADLPTIHYLPGSPWRWAVESFCKTHRLSGHALAETDDAQFMLESAMRGICLAFVPYSLARDALHRRKVRAVAALPTAGVALNAICHDGRRVAQAAQAVDVLLAYAKESFGQYEIEAPSTKLPPMARAAH